MLRAFFDDSEIWTGPMFTLAGWIGPAEKWAPFADGWQQILEMRPRISYFKFSEAISLRGEFTGISADSRDEKLAIFLRLIEGYKLVGISASLPREVFEGWHAFFPYPYNNPYFLLFFGVVHRICTYCQNQGIKDKVDFVFDNQPEHISKVLDAWNAFVSSAPEDAKEILGDPPIFRSDKTTLPLQAADFCAGWLRTMNRAVAERKEVPDPVWSKIAGNIAHRIKRFYYVAEWWDAKELYKQLFGREPITYTFGGIGTELSHPPLLHLPSWPV